MGAVLEAMQRSFWLLLLITALLCFLLLRGERGGLSPGGLQNGVRSAVKNPGEFGRMHFSGGVGVTLQADPDGGLPMIDVVSRGSPAEKAGLQIRDIIISVDGVSTKGQALSNVIAQVRGFPGASVRVGIERGRGTNFVVVIRRESWSRMQNHASGFKN